MYETQQRPMNSLELEADFFARHGRIRVFRPESKDWLFPTGAIMGKVSAHSGSRDHFEPPEIDQLRLTLALEFSKLRSEFARGTFLEIQGQLVGGRPPQDFRWYEECFGSLPDDLDGEPHGFRALLKLKDIYLEEHQRQKDIQREYDELPSVRAAKAREEQQRRYDELREAHRRRQIEMVRAIRLDDDIIRDDEEASQA